MNLILMPTLALLFVTRNVAQSTRCSFHFSEDLGTRLVSAYPIVSVTLPPCGKTKALLRVGITHTVIRIRLMAFINVTVN